MKKAAWILCCVLTANLLCGCSPRFLPQPKDISNVELVRTLAVDSAPEERVKVTVSSGVKQEESGSGGKEPLILEREADTVFAACQMIQKSGSGYVSYGHVTECIIGKGAAEAGIDRILDYIQRDYEMRLDTLIFSTEGTAAEIVTKSGGKDIAATDRLQEIGKELPLESKGWACTVREFLTDLYDNGWAMMPVVRLEKEEEQHTLVSDGMALFREAKLQEKFPPELGRGICLLLNQGDMSYLDLATQEDGVAGVKLTGQNCKWNACWEGEVLTDLTAEIQVQVDLSEVSGELDELDEDTMSRMERILAKTLTGEVVQVLEQEQKLGDFLHLKRTLMAQYPMKAALIQRQWEQWRKNLTFHVTTGCVIQQSYDVSRGVGQGE